MNQQEFPLGEFCVFGRHMIAAPIRRRRRRRPPAWRCLPHCRWLPVVKYKIFTMKLFPCHVSVCFVYIISYILIANAISWSSYLSSTNSNRDDASSWHGTATAASSAAGHDIAPGKLNHHFFAISCRHIM
jgi:hypothetical protein